MSVRWLRSRAPVLLGFAIACGAATGLGTPARAAAAAAGGPAVSLVSQSPWVTPDKTFDLSLDADIHRAGGPLGYVVSVYRRLTTRSDFEQSLTNTPTDRLDHTLPIEVTNSSGRSDLSIAIETSGASTTTQPALDIDCVSLCPGVYPVVVTLERLNSGAVLGRLTTYLTYVAGPAVQPLRVSLVLPFATPLSVRSTNDPAVALGAPSGLSTSSLSGMVDALTHYNTVPVTIGASPQSVQALLASGLQGQRSVSALATLSTQPAHQFLAEPYAPVDVGVLSAIPGELKAQFATGASVLNSAGIRSQRGTWVATGSVGTDLPAGLAIAGAANVVVPDSSLVAASGRNGTFAQTFSLTFAKTPVSAAVADGELTAQFNAVQNDPALAAYQLLADLAFVHFEYPNLSTPRGVVAEPPGGWQPNAAFLDALLSGLADNPDVSAVTLNSFFQSVPGDSGDGSGVVRRPATTGPGNTLSAALAQSIVIARIHLSDFASAVPSNPPVLGQMNDVLLAAEASVLRPAGQRDALNTVMRCLGAQLAFVQLANDRTITLTARTSSIPITILSSAPYPLVGNLELQSDKFIPESQTKHDFKVNRSTNSLRMAIQARTTGDLPLQVTLTTPVGGLVIAKGRLTVRSTSASFAGVVLTIAAAAVLLTWWLRTVRRRRSARRAGRHSPAAT